MGVTSKLNVLDEGAREKEYPIGVGNLISMDDSEKATRKQILLLDKWIPEGDLKRIQETYEADRKMS